MGILDQRSRRTPTERYTDQSSSSVEKSERFIQVKASQVPTLHTPGPHTKQKTYSSVPLLVLGAGGYFVVRAEQQATATGTGKIEIGPSWTLALY